MATKNVLVEAINKLVNANLLLQEKMQKETNKENISKYSKELTKNQSMILDYKFRLENEYE